MASVLCLRAMNENGILDVSQKVTHALRPDNVQMVNLYQNLNLFFFVSFVRCNIKVQKCYVPFVNSRTRMFVAQCKVFNIYSALHSRNIVRNNKFLLFGIFAACLGSIAIKFLSNRHYIGIRCSGICIRSG